MNNLYYLVYCERGGKKELNAAFTDKRNAIVYAEELNKRAAGRYRCYVEGKREAVARTILKRMNNASMRPGENVEEMLLREIEGALEEIAPAQKQEIEIEVSAKVIGERIKA